MEEEIIEQGEYDLVDRALSKMMPPSVDTEKAVRRMLGE